jgi:hypothetical protein
MIQRSVVEVYRRFWRTCCLHLQGWNVWCDLCLIFGYLSRKKLKIKVITSSGTSLNYFKTLPENDMLHKRRSDNLSICFFVLNLNDHFLVSSVHYTVCNLVSLKCSLLYTYKRTFSFRTYSLNWRTKHKFTFVLGYNITNYAGLVWNIKEHKIREEIRSCLFWYEWACNLRSKHNRNIS